MKAELRGSDVSAVLTSPHRLTDVERVIRGKTHIKGERPVFSCIHSETAFKWHHKMCERSGKMFHHRCMLGAKKTINLVKQVLAGTFDWSTAVSVEPV